MGRSMPEQPLVRSPIGYGFWTELRRRMSPEDFEQYVKDWNSRYSTGSPVSRPSSGTSNDWGRPGARRSGGAGTFVRHPPEQLINGATSLSPASSIAFRPRGAPWTSSSLR